MKTRKLENTYTVQREEGKITLHLNLRVANMTINWSMKSAATYSMHGEWYVNTAHRDWVATGSYYFEMEHKGTKPKKLSLDANVAEHFSPEERKDLALRIKRLLKEQVHHVIDNAWRELHSQTKHIW